MPIINTYKSEWFLSLFLGIVLFSAPFTRFFWDTWSQHSLFLYVLLLLTFIFLKACLFDRTITKPKFSLPLLFFIVFFAISSVNSSFRESARNESINIFNALISFFIVQELKPDSKIFLQKIFCFVAAIFSALFIIANISQEIGGQRERTEFFVNANLVGSFALLAFFIALNIFKETKPLSIATLILTTIAFCFTKSLSGLLGGVLALFYLFHSHVKNVVHSQISKKEKLLNPVRSFRIESLINLSFRSCPKSLITSNGVKWSGMILLGLILLGISILFFSEYGKNSLYDRLRWWSVSARILINHPFFGNGPGSFDKIAPYFYDSGLKSVYAHNYFLQIASELGILATLSLCYFFFTQMRRSNNQILIAGLTAVLFQNLFDFSMNIPGFFLIFCFVLAIASHTNDTILKPEPSLKETISRRNGRLLFVCALNLLLFVFAGWKWGVKPLMAFQESLRAQEFFKERDWNSTEKHLRKSIAWDKLPAKYYSDLSMVLTTRYQVGEKDPSLIHEAILLQKESLSREPLSKDYKNQMKFLLETADKMKNLTS